MDIDFSQYLILCDTHCGLDVKLGSEVLRRLRFRFCEAHSLYDSERLTEVAALVLLLVKCVLQIYHFIVLINLIALNMSCVM